MDNVLPVLSPGSLGFIVALVAVFSAVLFAFALVRALALRVAGEKAANKARQAAAEAEDAAKATEQAVDVVRLTAERLLFHAQDWEQARDTSNMAAQTLEQMLEEHVGEPLPEAEAVLRMERARVDSLLQTRQHAQSSSKRAEQAALHEARDAEKLAATAETLAAEAGQKAALALRLAAEASQKAKGRALTLAQEATQVAQVANDAAAFARQSALTIRQTMQAALRATQPKEAMQLAEQAVGEATRRVGQAAEAVSVVRSHLAEFDKLLRPLLRDELTADRRKSFWPNVGVSLLTNFIVGLIFFVLGVVVTLYLSQPH
jgi:hypothetical protein